MPKPKKKPDPPPKPVPEIKLVCQTSAGDGQDGCEYAVLIVDLDCVLKFLSLIGTAAIMKAMDSTFYRSFFHLSYVEYYSDWSPIMTCEWATDERVQEIAAEIMSDWVVLPDDFKPAYDASRVDCPTIGVSEDDIIFHCYPDGGGPDEVETKTLSRECLLTLAKKLMRLASEQDADVPPQGQRERVITLDR